MGIKIRELKAKDVRTVSAILKKISTETDFTWLRTAVKSSESAEDSETGASYIEVFFQLLGIAIDRYTDDLTSWFAELCGKTTEEYLDGPFDSDLQVIAQLRDSKDVEGFFKKACAGFSGSVALSSITSRLKTMFGSMIG